MVRGSCGAQDAHEGFTEEEGKRAHSLEGKAPPLGLPAHFALEGTAEHSIVSITAPASYPAHHSPCTGICSSYCCLQHAPSQLCQCLGGHECRSGPTADQQSMHACVLACMLRLERYAHGRALVCRRSS